MSGTHRAVWAWAPPSGDPLHPGALASFAVGRTLQEVHLSVPWDLDGHGAVLRRTADMLRDAGVTVSALGGDPGWVDHPEHARQWAAQAVDAIAADLVHLDIEPWARDDWGSGRRRLIDGYLRALRSATAAGHPCDVDVAHFLHDVVTSGGTLLDEVLTVADAITVMAYRDSVAGVVLIARPSVVAAVHAETPFRIGISVGPGPDSFHTAAAVESACLAIVRHYGDRPGFAGVAVHDYLGWRSLRAV